MIKEWRQIHLPYYFIVNTESVDGFMEGFNAAVKGTSCDYVGDDSAGRAATQGYTLGAAMKLTVDRVLTGFGQEPHTAAMVRPPEDHCPRCGRGMTPYPGEAKL